ncbi:Aminopeptidase N [Nannocystis exedens]|uniref:Aminopeptidase N n=1 Tax=Nannocystis exedens TaxID=54 RepID=A0A1I1SSZ9_9BACT|nr:M1 family metallopeptidase [Nannocystis exedens]PCC75613.1 aminopeptidase [Nannocystis exedens]SFD47878.1 Aminopeptidase N [Nannocystis exedens]
MSRLLVALAALTVSACSAPAPATPIVTPPAAVVQLPAVPQPGRDPHSFARPDEVRVDAIELDLTVDFDAHVLRGSATLALTRSVADAPLVLDTRDLEIERVEAHLPDRTDWVTTTHALAGPHPILGQALSVDLPPGADRVRVHYRTSPASTGLQWLAPEQTSDRAGEFLYTQSQAIHARSWVPCQDSPGIRAAVAARIAAPAPYRAVMAAEELSNETGPNGHVLRTFKLDQPIPAYLLALAVGRLESVQLGPRTAVWAEPGVLPRARAEFADLEAMLTAAEAAVGPYRWGRYEVLVLPAAFPFGGMENPRVTFVTPTILAGDRSLVSLIAHELAHSWSGNLVTNATWRDFWLNEGFTVYVERRILEAIYGRERAEVEAVLGREHLEIELADMSDRPGDQILHLDLSGRDPDDAVTDVAYEKGALFLRRLEQAYGRDAFDPFVRAWFDRHAFTGQTTEAFRAFLTAELKAPLLPGQTAPDVDRWLEAPGLPEDAPRPQAASLTLAADAAREFAAGRKIDARAFSPLQWIHFLRALPLKDGSRPAAAVLAELDAAYHFTAAGNAELLSEWLILAARHGYRPADARIREFLTSVGRRKYVLPIYDALLATPEGAALAREIFAVARPGYHAITRGSLDALLGAP